MFDEKRYEQCVRRFADIGINFDDVLNDFFDSALLYGDVPYVDIAKTCQENDLIVSSDDAVVDFSVAPWRRIHPYKRKLINEILKSDIPAGIQQIIIFGSAITPRCRYDSDTDLAIITDDGVLYDVIGRWFGIGSYMRSCPMDIIKVTADEFAEKNKGVFIEIKENGLCIYRREAS